MALSPQPDDQDSKRLGPPSPPGPWCPATRPLALVLLLAGGIVLGGWSADQALRRAYGRLRPRLEQSLGQSLGHPLQLGPYAGLGPAGVRFGPSRLLPGPQDGSSARVQGIDLRLAPLASLRRGLPVLELQLRHAQLDLRRNDRGQYWVLGPPGPPRALPRLDLRVMLVQPALVRLEPAGMVWRWRGTARLEPHRHALDLRGLLQPQRGAGSGGSLAARLQGRWDRPDWRLELRPHGLPLVGLGRLLQLPGALEGRADGQLQLRFARQRRDCRGEFSSRGLRWRPGPGSGATALELPGLRLRCAGELIVAPSSSWRWGNQAGTLTLQGRYSHAGLELQPLTLRRGRSWLRLAGRLQPNPRLQGQWLAQPADLPVARSLAPQLQGPPLRGGISWRGPWRQPQLTLTAAQPSNTLLGPWQAQLRWSDGLLRLERFAGDHLQASGRLPLALRTGRGLATGPLDLALELRRFPLQRLDPLVGTRLRGWLNASGSVRGPLARLEPDLRLQVDQPAAGPVALAERWRGEWFGAAEGGGRLALRAEQPAPPGALTLRLNRRWLPEVVSLERGGGRLQLTGSPRSYRWRAQRFPLAGLQLALGPRGRLRPLQGLLSGSGHLDLQPLAFAGRVELERPALLGIWGRQARLEGRYAQRRYQLSGELELPQQGRLDLSWSGSWRGPFRSRVQFRQLGQGTFSQIAQAWPLWLGRESAAPGAAWQLGSHWIDRLGASIDAQLAALGAARQRLAGARAEQDRLSPAQRLAALGMRADGELRLEGPRLREARADLEARAQFWRPFSDRDQPLGDTPLVLRFNGPLLSGAGAFALEGLPLGLLGLLTPVPQQLRGTLQARGRYRLGGRLPELSLVLDLADGRLGDSALVLDRGQFGLRDQRLEVDLSLRAEGATSSLDLAGVVPIDPGADGLELRLSSRDDGLRFLSRLAEPALLWRQGSGDLQLLVRGSLERPIANGFLRVRAGELSFIGQPVRELEALVLFDFEELLLQELTGRVGDQGRISGAGRLRLFSPAPSPDAEPPGLEINLSAVPFSLPRIKAVADGRLRVDGTLLAMDIGGELGIGRGRVNVQPGRLDAAGRASTAATVPQLLESRWDFQQPLVLLGNELESGADEALRAAVPRFRPVGFRNLGLRLGPDLTVGVPNLANFTASGLLRLSGRLDPSLQAQGVVRLLRGRLNLFTTSFSLDPNAANVAVFTPSLGLVPYLDIDLTTRVSDSLNVGGGIGSGGSLSLAELEQVDSNALNKLNLVRVFLSVSGPADRLAQNLRLRSTPPLPEDRLLALIGGNSLAGLAGSGASTALATVLGQSLLSPVLGTLSDAFGERVSLALYPAYVNQEVSGSGANRSGRVPPQLVLGAELGLDLTERFNASVLAAPNRSDVPPQLNLTYKATELLNLQGSIDSQGAWQTQLQIFFRF